MCKKFVIIHKNLIKSGLFKVFWLTRQSKRIIKDIVVKGAKARYNTNQILEEE